MPRADSARADEGTAADRTPCRKIVMPRFSRPPRVLFRTLFSASVKEAAICPAPHQPWCEDMMGVHASLLVAARPQCCCPIEAVALRESAALSREPWLELWQREAAAAPPREASLWLHEKSTI